MHTLKFVACACETIGIIVTTLEYLYAMNDQDFIFSVESTIIYMNRDCQTCPQVFALRAWLVYSFTSSSMLVL